MIAMAQKMELGGVVIDDNIRDIIGVKETKFPVFCIRTTIAVGGKAGVGELQVPISCGGVSVSPGDFIIGDADGVTVVSKDKINEVFALARQKEERNVIRTRETLVSKKRSLGTKPLNSYLLI